MREARGEQGSREEHAVQVPGEPRPGTTGPDAHEEALKIQRGELESSRNKQLHCVWTLSMWVLWFIAIIAVFVAGWHFVTPWGWMGEEKDTLYTIVTTSVVAVLMTIVITNSRPRE